MQETIEQQFETSLVIPPSIEKPQFFLCPVGFIGAGKTTIMKALCERLSVIRVENDYARKLFRAQGNFDSNYARDLTRVFILKYLEQGYRIGIDANCGGPRRNDPNSVENISRKTGIPIIWIHINPPEEFILCMLTKRHSSSNHTWLFRDAQHAIERYFFWKDQANYADIDFTYVFDTSRDDVDEQIENSIQAIQKRISEL